MYSSRRDSSLNIIAGGSCDLKGGGSVRIRGEMLSLVWEPNRMTPERLDVSSIRNISGTELTCPSSSSLVGLCNKSVIDTFEKV
jgi:hypothetical protein